MSASTETTATTENAVLPLVDLDACAGHGRCFATAPDLFDSDEDGWPVVRRATRTAEEVAALKRVISNCPEHALSSRPA